MPERATDDDDAGDRRDETEPLRPRILLATGHLLSLLPDLVPDVLLELVQGLGNYLAFQKLSPPFDDPCFAPR